MDHITAHSTGHSDGILTESLGNAQRFVNEVNSAAVFVNAGAPAQRRRPAWIGRGGGSQHAKTAAHGPMGLQELPTTYKWVVYGDGHVRE